MIVTGPRSNASASPSARPAGGLGGRRRRLDLHLQRRPAVEAVLTGENSLSVGERRPGIGLAQRDEQVFRLLAQEIRMGIVRQNTHSAPLPRPDSHRPKSAAQPLDKIVGGFQP
jgi:hypothetical protein